MPTYEYKCTVCDEHFEIEQSFTDNPVKTKAGCEVAKNGRHKLKKVFSAVGISFKGDGFYRNDSRGSSSSSSSSSSGGDSSSSSSSSSDGESSSSSKGSESSNGSGSSSNGSSSSDSSSSSSKASSSASD